jgi:hypothetical protein
MDLDRAISLFRPQREHQEVKSAILEALGNYPSLLLAMRERHRLHRLYASAPEFAEGMQPHMEISRATCCLIRHAHLMQNTGIGIPAKNPPPDWPWDPELWMPPHRIEDAIVTAIGLLSVELDRMLRTKAKEEREARLEP